MPYSPIDYWTRLHARDDLSAVGQSSLPPGLNRWLYRALERNVGSFLWRHGLSRRSHKAHVTWPRMLRIAGAWLARVRIVHPYPSQRLALRT